jgi:hypothetical protein
MANSSDLRMVLSTACDLESEKETRLASRTETRMVALMEGDLDCLMPSRSDDLLEPMSGYASVFLASESVDLLESQLAASSLVSLWAYSWG